jgi:hypothetical protein
MQQFTVRLEDDAMKLLISKANESDIPPAVLARDLITKSLALDFSAQQRDAMEILLRECVHDEMKPIVDRLAALGAKSGIMAASSYFMLMTLIDSVYGDQVDVKDLTSDSRRKAIEYVRDKSATEQ